jgi:phosphoglycolate phosphatase
VTVSLNKYDVIVWDWNGTLLDDHQVCTDNFNRCISRQNIAPISSSHFRSIYRHPIIDMYLDVGFKFDQSYSFADLSIDWYNYYQQSIDDAALFPQVVPLISSIKESGKLQIVCSALEDKYLATQVARHKISNIFHKISGHHDLEAESKVDRGVGLIKPHLDAGKSVVMIGDSSHDAEVARAAGCDCILLASGHESEDRLSLNKEAHLRQSLDELII